MREEQEGGNGAVAHHPLLGIGLPIQLEPRVQCSVLVGGVACRDAHNFTVQHADVLHLYLYVCILELHLYIIYCNSTILQVGDISFF